MHDPLLTASSVAWSSNVCFSTGYATAMTKLAEMKSRVTPTFIVTLWKQNWLWYSCIQLFLGTGEGDDLWNRERSSRSFYVLQMVMCSNLSYSWGAYSREWMLFEASKRCSAFTGFCCLGIRGSKELSYLTVCVGLNWAGRIDEWHAIKAETLYEIIVGIWLRKHESW